MLVKRIGPSTGPGVSGENDKGNTKLKNIAENPASLKHITLPTLYSDIDVSSLGTIAVLGLNSVDTTMVPIYVTNEQTASADSTGDLNVNHSPLINLLAILVPDNLWNRTSADAAAKFKILTGFQIGNLVWGPSNLRSN